VPCETNIASARESEQMEPRRGSICSDSALALDFAWPRGSLGSIIAIRYVLRQMEIS